MLELSQSMWMTLFTVRSELLSFGMRFGRAYPAMEGPLQLSLGGMELYSRSVGKQRGRGGTAEVLRVEKKECLSLEEW